MAYFTGRIGIWAVFGVIGCSAGDPAGNDSDALSTSATLAMHHESRPTLASSAVDAERKEQLEEADVGALVSQAYLRFLSHRERNVTFASGDMMRMFDAMLGVQRPVFCSFFGCKFYERPSAMGEIDQREWQNQYNAIPILSDPEVFTRLYSEMKIIGTGTRATVLSGRSNTDRPNGLTKGDRIALRFTGPGTKEDLIREDGVTKASARLSLLKQPANASNSSDQLVTGISDLHTTLYGVYFTSTVPPEFKESETGRYLQSHPMGPDQVLMVQEMELGDFSFEDAYLQPNGGIPDSAVFELLIGKWGEAAVAKNLITDELLRNYLATDVPYFRVYHVEDKDYVFPPGTTPRRIDFGDVWSFDDLQATNFVNLFATIFLQTEMGESLLKHAKTAHAQKALAALQTARTTIFDVLPTYFSDYIAKDRDWRSVVGTTSVKHYSVSSPK